MHAPSFTENLSQNHISFLNAFSKSCRNSIVEMVTIAKSGHPGGSLSSLDYLSLLYTFIISQTGEDVVVSNGHISPAVYSVLAELGYIPKDEAVQNFRKIGSIFEGHITRHVKGVLYGTGPLGIGVSVGSSFALAEKLRKTDKKTYGIMGDGECQEGQVYEMINFSKKYNLNNFILFIDYNRVQLTDSLENIMPIDIKAIFVAGGWQVLEADGHNFENMWEILKKAQHEKEKPIVIIGHTIMGKGIPSMEEDGQKYRSTWHGKAPKKEEAEKDLSVLKITEEEKNIIWNFYKNIKWYPKKPEFTESLEKNNLNTGTPIVYTKETLTDCRTAYGKALLDLAINNPEIIVLAADLGGSVMTKFVNDKYPDRHIECGIAEQHMLSSAGGLSLKGFIPFASTFGAFLTSRAKDQVRVNDINRTNVKMVATHCGLSVGEDGPTHQVVDDMGSFLGLFNTMIIEPSDPNHTDRIIRYIASHYGNFYVRMGRHKIPTILKTNGTPFYDENYIYEYGKTDILREGKDITIVAIGSMVNEALRAINLVGTGLAPARPNTTSRANLNVPSINIELIACNSIKKFDKNIIESVKKTGRLLTIEDHNPECGLGAQICKHLIEQKIYPKSFEMLGVNAYQLSGTVEELYHANSLDDEGIKNKILEMMK